MPERNAPPDQTGGASTSSERLRDELQRLRDELASLRAEAASDSIRKLRETNEKLVRAALRAERVAEVALRLGRRARLHAARRVGRSSLRERNLRDANEAILITALAGRRHERDLEHQQLRQMRYLAMVAHELRNPLSPLRNASDLLDRAGGNREMLLELQAMITRQVAHMTRLVEDLIDGARAERSAFRVDRSRIDLVAVLRHVVAACQPAIAARRQQLELDLPDPPLMLDGDEDRLRQLFGNLLDNACKYTPVGGRIRVSARIVDGSIRVVVADDGIGIEPAALERVFDVFVQQDHALDVDRRGLGIGLAVVRSLAEAHGGRIVARSAGVGRGSEFEVMLPLAPAAPASDAPNG